MAFESNIHRWRQVHGQVDVQIFKDAKFQRGPIVRYSRSLATTQGPASISRMRKEAASAGLDADQWSNNVRTRDLRENWSRNDDVRAQHL